jgi:hypothetical protein
MPSISESAPQNANGQRALIPVGPRGVELRDVDAMFRFARCYLQSGLAPTSFKNEQQLVICWAKAAELGLSPLQAVEGMTIINNRVGIMGDLALAMVEASGLLEQKRVEYSGEGDSLECKVTLQRKGREPQTYSFSVREARAAGIYERSATWKSYPRRMVYYRALGFGLRDEFSDVLKGTKTVEELMDYEQPPEAKRRTRTIAAEVQEPPRTANKVAEPPTAKDAPESQQRPLVGLVRQRLGEVKISEVEFIELLKLAQITEADGATSLADISDRTLALAVESWPTVLELASELRAQKAEAA